MRSSRSGSPTSVASPNFRDEGAWRAWLLAARPKTLTASLVPVLVGTAVAAAVGAAWRPWISLTALAAALAIQIATNFINDALDFAKGADTAERLGPRRVVASGLLRGPRVLRAGYAALALAAALAVPLVVVGGWPIAVLAVVSLVCGYAYTGGPFPLAYVGLGDLFVLLFFGVAAVGGTAWLQAGTWNAAFLVAGLQVGALATVLIAVNNLRDIDGDTRAGKRTLAVRLGRRGARMEIALLVVIANAAALWWLDASRPYAALLPLLSLPFAAIILRDVFRMEPSPAYNGILARAAALHLLFGALLTLGLMLGRAN